MNSMNAHSKNILVLSQTCAVRSASVLLMVLVAVAMMSLTAGSYLALMQNEHAATRYNGRRQQARMLVESGVEYLQAILAQPDEEIDQQGGLWDNPDLLQSVLVVEDSMAAFRGRFTVLANNLTQGNYSALRYGLENESAKLNINTLVDDDDDKTKNSARQRLLAIPGMEAAVADAILDWLDEDSSPREFGAEAEYYHEISPIYEPRNGPLSSLDELLMVKGVTAELLYGLDSNRSYAIETQEEQTPGPLEKLDNANGQLDRGWSAYLTIHSQEQISNPEGKAKLDVNTGGLEGLYKKLLAVASEEEAKFIIAYRQYGAASAEATGDETGLTNLELDWKAEPKTKIVSLLDLIGARVAVPNEQGDEKKTLVFESPWQEDDTTLRDRFTKLLNAAHIGDVRRIAGRISVDKASEPVLMSIPGMTQAIADQIVNQRGLQESDATDKKDRHPIWMLIDGIVTIEEMRQFEPYVTAGGDVYSAQIVGFFESSTPRSRAEVFLDRSGKNTRIVSWQDLTKLGPGVSRRLLGEDEENLRR